MSEIPELTHVQTNIFNALSHGKSLTRHELVEKLKKPRTTIYDNLLKLQNKKLVEKFSINNQERGRPIVLWYNSKKYILNQIKNGDENGKF